ncbi:hydrogenase expression/formation protein HypE [Clostridium acetireducens DSM 10703]|uniref:Hydrogenase expression/formation protein HypE n=1 Tax=Clostridium acetireducens DSM 10703 TaxID=1121290 RepID=A0A1E8F0Z2_9CLOT|nr:hydrogenase expression/formation protein HypE [Clostridium acetireducens]OFI07123.1 hydrogenase expression/formation protein HypE [Clostridium acetireducens DSM 10703]
MITLSHGNGGEETHKLIKDIFYKYFKNEVLNQMGDSNILNEISRSIAITTDSFVVDPIFFNGGDIGKLSVCGTINDLAVSGALPKYITAAFIIEEGLEINVLEKVAKSMAKTAAESGVKIIAGDTKVVNRGKGDKLYINTTGIGILENAYISFNKIKPKDKIIVNGNIGEHGICILNEREYLNFQCDIKSDCAPLNKLCKDILSVSNNVRIMRDATRGGVATTLNEIVNTCKKSMLIYEEEIPVSQEVESFCHILGFDPLYVANEGKIVVIVDEKDAANVLKTMKNNPLGKNSKIIGEVIEDKSANLYLKTSLGGTKILPMLQGEILPRIC